MAKNAETQEPKTFKQIKGEKRTAKTFEAADSIRKSILGVLKENEQVRIRYRKSTDQYDVLWMRKE